MAVLVETLTPLVRSTRNMHQALQTAREGIRHDPLLIELRDLLHEPKEALKIVARGPRVRAKSAHAFPFTADSHG